jgi:hypothetical protein
MLVGAARDELAGLVLERAGVLLVQMLDRGDDALALLGQQLAEAFGVDRARRA